jgi:hypothetical protein
MFVSLSANCGGRVRNLRINIETLEPTKLHLSPLFCWFFEGVIKWIETKRFFLAHHHSNQHFLSNSENSPFAPIFFWSVPLVDCFHQQQKSLFNIPLEGLCVSKVKVVWKLTVRTFRFFLIIKDISKKYFCILSSNFCLWRNSKIIPLFHLFPFTPTVVSLFNSKSLTRERITR